MTWQPHPECGHDACSGPDLFDVVCCICDDNPCSRVTVERMREHRLFDIAVFSAAVFDTLVFSAAREVSDARRRF